MATPEAGSRDATAEVSSPDPAGSPAGEQDQDQSPDNPVESAEEKVAAAERSTPDAPTVVQEDVSETEQAELTPLDHSVAVVRGLSTARRLGQINYGTTTYYQAQTAILLLRRGNALPTVARRSGLKRSILTQLIQWGAP